MGLAFSAVSWIGTCLVGSAASCVCEGLKQLLPSGYTAAKVYALILFFATVLTAIILRAKEPKIDAKYFQVQCTGIYKDRCFGYQAVYRVSFVDFFFYLALAIGSKLSVGFHTHAWGLKYLVYVGSLFGMFFVENKVFEGYVHLARIASLLYLVAQVVTLVNFSYMLHSNIMAKLEAAESNGDSAAEGTYKATYLVLSIGCLAVALTSIGLLYAYYGACRLSQFWISLTLILGLICVVSSVSSYVNMGLLTPSFLFLYFCYQCWSAILSNPEPKCNFTATMTTGKAKNWNTAVSLVFLSLSLTYTGWSTYQSFAGQQLTEADARSPAPGDASMDPNLKKVLTGEGGAAPATQATTTATAGSPQQRTEEGGSGKQHAVPDLAGTDTAEAQYIWGFHLLLALAGSYMAMAITNWGSPSGSPDVEDTTVGKESMWLKIVAQWLTILLYGWSLWAPYFRGEVEV